MDTRDTQVQNLLFLLAAAPLGVGCVVTSDDDSDTTVNSTNTPTTDATAGETDPTAGTTQTPEDSTTMTPGDTTLTPEDSSSTLPPEDTTMGPDDTTTGGNLPPSCAAYADLVTMCYDDKAGATAAMYCVDTLAYYEMTYGAECVAAYEDYLACLSALTCEMLTGKDPVCETEFDMIGMICVAK